MMLRAPVPYGFAALGELIPRDDFIGRSSHYDSAFAKPANEAILSLLYALYSPDANTSRPTKDSANPSDVIFFLLLGVVHNREYVMPTLKHGLHRLAKWSPVVHQPPKKQTTDGSSFNI
ncbi:hypothetical protein [Fodinibius halophilus]|uniref:Uncharacterized protein n=1 Tax=Fodinibius halophilus TaxID=1736908 RepID=A0A6M1T7R2_9BACT|nr:hypothetical protein [Fodinibius halophilus]NGP89445.1 hypothetical protein [Fodinibius halophilus]